MHYPWVVFGVILEITMESQMCQEFLGVLAQGPISQVLSCKYFAFVPFLPSSVFYQLIDSEDLFIALPMVQSIFTSACNLPSLGGNFAVSSKLLKLGGL